MRILAVTVFLAACSTGKPDHRSTIATAPTAPAAPAAPTSVCGAGGEPSHAPASDSPEAMQDCSYEVDRLAGDGTTVACCYPKKADACAQLGCPLESCVDNELISFDQPRCEHGEYGVEPP